jgi:GNAT superfamily N-acetyltransferase
MGILANGYKMAGMNVSAIATTVHAILPMRERYRQEMDCQIIHDSLHFREGWTQPYHLSVGADLAGYGSVVSGGPWVQSPAIFEFYILPEHRQRIFDLFTALLTTSGTARIETQTNDPQLTIMLHTFSATVMVESLLFRDEITTSHALPGAVFRAASAEDVPSLQSANLDHQAPYVVQWADAIAAAGGILHHYNPPYGDIYMKVAEPHRRRGIGTYLVQELKRVCRQSGKVPGARCNPANAASRRTLQAAGFVPCGHILAGTLSSATPV